METVCIALGDECRVWRLARSCTTRAVYADNAISLRQAAAGAASSRGVRVRRMERHIDTSLSTFNRAMAYTLAELATLGVTVAVQITTIHALFKNRRSSRGILGS